MSALAKSGLTWAVVMGLLGAYFVVHYQNARGLFTPITPISPGICRAIAPGIKGPADLAIDAAHNAIFVAARDGLYLLKLDDPAAAPLRVTDTPADFHPEGIELYRAPDSSQTLTAIDRRPGDVRLVEIFSLRYDGGAPKLGQQSAIRSRQLIDPHDLAAVGANHFYVANAHAATSALGRFAEDYLLWAHADLLLFNGLGFRVAVQRIALPSGILAKGSFLYVAAGNERRLIAFSREDFTGNLTEIGSLALPARPDKISADAAGNLIVAGQSKPGSAQVFRVRLDANGVPQSYDTLFSDDGHVLNGASAAVLQGGHLFIASASDNKMLDCQVK